MSQSIESIYGVPFEQLKPPAGYRFKVKDGAPEFGAGEKGDAMLGKNGNGVFIAEYPVPNMPRLLLERMEEPLSDDEELTYDDFA